MGADQGPCLKAKLQDSVQWSKKWDRLMEGACLKRSYCWCLVLPAGQHPTSDDFIIAQEVVNSCNLALAWHGLSGQSVM